MLTRTSSVCAFPEKLATTLGKIFTGANIAICLMHLGRRRHVAVQAIKAGLDFKGAIVVKRWAKVGGSCQHGGAVF